MPKIGCTTIVYFLRFQIQINIFCEKLEDQLFVCGADQRTTHHTAMTAVQIKP